MILTLIFKMCHGQNVNTLFESKRSNFLCVSISNISSIFHHLRYSQSKFSWPWLWPLEWQKVKCKYTNRKPIDDFLWFGNSNICPICHHLEDFQSKFEWPWLWSLGWAKIKCKCTIRKPISYFLCAGNGNIYSIFHSLWDIRSQHLNYLDFDL